DRAAQVPPLRERPATDHPGLRILPREPAASALPARRRAARHPFRRPRTGAPPVGGPRGGAQVRKGGRALRAPLPLKRILVAIVLVAVFLGVASLVRGTSSSHTDHAVQLVPADALVYAHLTFDRSSGQWRNARRIAANSPALSSLLVQAGA